MSRIEIYRKWYEQEKESNKAMLQMLSSVPTDVRGDDRFKRAVVLAAHLAACRENWLDRMISGGMEQSDWWPSDPSLDALPARYEALEDRWTEYLAGLNDDHLDVDFEFFYEPDKGYRWNIEGQIMQLIGHAFYHRGQIALLVGELGGQPVDTDYLYWAFQQEPDRWTEISVPSS